MKKSMMNSMRGSVWLQALALLIMFPSLVMMPSTVRANPSGGVVVHGGIEMNVMPDGTPMDPAFLQILQSTDKAIINWQDFSIAAGEHTQFVQPSQMAAVLNRVVSGNPSVLAGMLSANGKVLVVNQNGIIVTPSGVVDAAGGVVLSTLDIADGDFLNGMDDTFLGTSAAGVTNYGTIMSAGGDVVLLGNFVDNQGTIGAPDGVVALGAGGNIVVHAQGENKISIVAPGVGAETGVNNAGSINGAAAELKAHGNVYALAINNSGTIRATGSATIAGRVMLTSRSADGKTGGNIENTGEIKANNPDGSGGFVMVDGGPGSNVGILDGKISTNGIGDTPGGDIVIIGQTINIANGAEVTANGSDGGSIVIGSVEDTNSVTIGGKVSANGKTGNGGAVMVVGDSTSVLSVTGTGRIEATGAVNGGLITMQGGSVHAAVGSVIDAGGAVNGGTVAVIGEDPNGVVNMNGTVNAAGGTGAGGAITVSGAGDVSVGRDAVMNADGANGGLVSIDGAGVTTQAGTVTALGNNGVGGTANVTGQSVVVAVQATMDVSGLTGGGNINVGGGFQGGDENLRNSESTIVGGLASLKADAINSGNAGNVAVWSSGDTIFGGDVSARALGEVGNGGVIEVSGLRNLTFRGSAVANSVNGRSGMVLFDPGDMTIGSAADSIEISVLNATLQSGTSVILATDNTDGATGDIIFRDLGFGGTGQYTIENGYLVPVRAIEWTNSNASLGIFASGDVRFNNHVRTSGGGDIAVIAGWTGLEADFLPGGAFSADFGLSGTVPSTQPTEGSGFDDVGGAGGFDVAAVWEAYVEAGQFGDSQGTIFVNDVSNARPVNVGTRYGKLLSASHHMIISTPQGNTGESMYAHWGFRDTGQIFAIRGTMSDQTMNANMLTLDLNGGALEADNDVIVGVAGQNEVDWNGDGIVDGVHAITSAGVHTDTFIPYANHPSSERSYGNYWWQQIDAANPDPMGLGGRRPEMGAGTSSAAADRADIAIVTTGAVIVQSGGRHQSYAQVGHGGDSTGWFDDKSARSGGRDGERSRLFSYNGAPSDRTSTSIARLAPVYGSIDILAGVNRNDVQVDLNSADGKTILTTGSPLSSTGIVQLRGWQNTYSSNAPTNPNSTNASEAYVQIGHLGTGQFGQVWGHISVAAGGDIDLLAGAHTRDYAKIGHTMASFAYWNPASNPDQQIRFFDEGNFGDFDNPNLRKGELFRNPTDTGVGRGLYPVGHRAGRWDDDWNGQAAQNGTVHVAALVGSSPKTIFGDISVESYGANGITIKAYTTPDTRTRTTDDSRTTGDLDGDGLFGQNPDSTMRTADNDDIDGLTTNRDSRFAGIGHGGITHGTWSDHDDERERLRVITGPDGTGVNSASVEWSDQSNNSQRSRNMSFVNLIGDIETHAYNGDIDIVAGNDVYDFAHIGHGGREVGDLETSNVAIGAVNVSAAGDLLLQGGEVEAPHTGNARRDDKSNYAVIGHHGSVVNLQYMAGDITVDIGGAINMVSGRARQEGVVIGHRGQDDSWGQVGGTYSRSEEFLYGMAIDGANPTLSLVDVTSTTVTIVWDETNDGVGTNEKREVYGISGNTSNIRVDAGGDISMTHTAPSLMRSQNQMAISTDGNVSTNKQYWAPAHIGHGARNTDAFHNTSTGNPQYKFKDKTGDIDVISGGNITMENGSQRGRWSIIGHVAGQDDSGNTSPNDIDNALVLIGNINVTAAGFLRMNADAALANDPSNHYVYPGQPGSAPTDPGWAQTQMSPVVIGHTGIWNNNDLLVLDGGQDIHGITASSDIDVTVGGDMEMLGGKGRRGTYAQVGHSAFSSGGGNAYRPDPEGLSGDIMVTVGGELNMTASAAGVVHEPQRLATPSGNIPDDNRGRQAGDPGVVVDIPVMGGYAAIGNGGIGPDVNVTGNVVVNVTGNVTMTASQRRNVSGTTDGTDASGDALGNWANFTQIGNFLNRTPQTGDNLNGDANGNTTLTVGGDLTMIAGRAAAGAQEISPVNGAYNQIGNSGLGANGDKIGDVTVLVGGNLTTVDGQARVDISGGGGTLSDGTNYNKIGNGDWLRDGFAITDGGNAGNRGSGTRSGTVTVSVGNTANFDHTIVGHVDPLVRSTTDVWNTYVGVSRANSFFGGPGQLITNSTTLFSSGGGSLGLGEMRFYMPGRSSNLMAVGTRINNDAFAGADVDFMAPVAAGTSVRGVMAPYQRNDEIYLQPDWWSDNLGVGGGVPFPGGSVATVGAVGGFADLVSLTPGSLGDGTTIDAHGEAIYLGAAFNVIPFQYTLYYDAIQAVPPAPGVPPVTPPAGGAGAAGAAGGFFPTVAAAPILAPIFVPDFDLFNFLFFSQAGADLFGYTERDWLIKGDVRDAGGDTSAIPGEEGRQPGVIFGVANRQLTAEEADREKRRRARYHYQISNGGKSFYVYQMSTRQYSSLRLFGRPQSPSPAQ